MTKEDLQFIQKVPLTDYPQKIVDFVQWGISNYPSKYLALIFDDHGSGIIDPKFIPVKGVLFNLENKTYLNTQQLSETMQQIKNILGRKVDLVGFDACLMAGIEVQYQIRDKANIFVGSEEIESGNGWPLSEIFEALTSRSLTPFELANVIVHAYGLFYRRSLRFTLSAVDLEEIIHLKENHNQIITQLKKCQKSDGNKIKDAIQNARKKCYKFPPIYVDLSSFYSELYKSLQDPSLAAKTKKLEESLTNGIKLIEKTVIANVTGKRATRAKGISIYYPKHSPIHPSYFETKFAQESNWWYFLRDNLLEKDNQSKKRTLSNIGNWVWNWLWKDMLEDTNLQH